MVEVGSWKNMDDMEECLILDELLLLTEQLNEKRKNEFRLVAMAQGVDIDEEGNDSGEDLPEEVLEAERAFKAAREQKAKDQPPTQFADGLGYEVVS